LGTGVIRYFDWLGAAIYNADRHTSAMHGKQFLLDAIHAGIDEENLYGRLDFCEMPHDPVQMVVNIDVQKPAEAISDAGSKHIRWRLAADIDQSVKRWELREMDPDRVVATSEHQPLQGITVAMTRTFEFRLPLSELRVEQGSQIYLRFSLWHEGLPIDALPMEGSVVLRVLSEEELDADVYNYSVSS
jgi:hypothetical protein